MQRFDAEKIDIALFLNLFERQARKLQIDDCNLVSELLSLLPSEIAGIIIREPEESNDDYTHVKSVLLDRFKLSAEAFRTKFQTHQRQNGALWKDLIFELKSYLEGWLDGIEVNDFDSLKNLMVADQIKRRVPVEIKDHFVDLWGTLNDPKTLVDKLDNYESTRRFIKKPQPYKPPEKKTLDRPRLAEKSSPAKETRIDKSSPKDWRNTSSQNNNEWRTKEYEKRSSPTCFHCGQIGHIRPQCPDLKKSTERVNNIVTTEDFSPGFRPYLKQAYVNNVQTMLLRDSGSCVDLCPFKLIKPGDFTGEKIWVKQPLDNEFKCLPVARVTISSSQIGEVQTKAAIVGKSVEMNHYLLGNSTQELIDAQTLNRASVNAVLTRSQGRRDSNKSSETVENGETVERETGSPEPEIEAQDELENIELPVVVEAEDSLIEVSADAFALEQRNCPELEPLWEKVRQKKTLEFVIENELLFRSSRDHRGEERKQLIVPTKYKYKILSLCHDGIGAHMGMGKTKDKLLRYYFWPQCIKECEDFVRSCDPCQRIGKSQEQKKAPLKLVPVITEVFSKINLDIVGPLPTSPKGNRYILTALCMASKYPEAIPLSVVNSENVTGALLEIFSRIGFPREIQLDNATYFTSNLTTTFLEKFGIKVTRSSIFHPQSNPIERFHRTVKRLLKVICLEANENWETGLPSAMLALRNVTHMSTGFSPAELIFGKNLRVPETLLFEKWCKNSPETNVVTEYVFELMNRLRKCQEIASETEREIKIKRKEYYDRGAVKREFKIGDKVLVLSACPANKLAVKWIGPGEIEKKLSETNYVVKMPGKKDKVQVYHVNLLKSYHQRMESVNVLMCGEFANENCETDLEIQYPVSSPNIFDYNEIIKDSMLEDRCTPEQIVELGELLNLHRKLFSNDPGRTHLIEHDIELISDKPVRSKPYRTSPRQNEILKTEIKRMLDLKIIEIGESDYTSPMILVESPGRDPRPCVDYRRLNSVIRTEYYPLPNMDDRIEKVAAAKFITVIDLTKGYWQIPLSARAQRFASFVTTFGTYRPLVLPFGLVNAPYCFSKFMAQLLQGCDDFCVPYLDDIAIFSENWQDHLKHLDVILRKIASARLTIKPAKCKFAQGCVKYLGHMVGEGRRTPTEAKIKAVVDFPTPQNKTQIRQFLGLSGYYARYIPNYAVLAEPLTRALKGKNRKEDVTWSEECNTAFQELKTKLTEKPVLYAPDFSKEFILQTDASDIGVGIILAQKGSENTDHPVLYLSKKFTSSEKKFCTTEKECAGIIYAIKKLRHYLDGQSFTIETDHNPLVFLKTNAGNNQRLMRWALALQPFNYQIVHRSGKLIGHADCLSRLMAE